MPWVVYIHDYCRLAACHVEHICTQLLLWLKLSSLTSCHRPPLHRIPEGQGEAGSLAAGRLRSLEDQLTRAKQKIHSFQKLSGDGRHSFERLNIGLRSHSGPISAPSSGAGLCVLVPHWAAVEGVGKLSEKCEWVGKCGNDAQTLWMPHWQNKGLRAEGKYRRTSGQGGQRQVSLSVVPKEKKKLKITPGLFHWGGGREKEERPHDRVLRGKKAFPSPLSPPSFSCSRLSLPISFSSSSETRAGGCVIHVGPSRCLVLVVYWVPFCS